jgi:hypothetical protein
MKKTEAIDKPVRYGCDFCKATFLREKTTLSHICEGKHRWLERDRQGNRIGFQAWLQFYKKNMAGNKNRTYEEFIKNAYYTAFAKFGLYCVGVNCINVGRFSDWLLKNQIKIDNWCQDSNYTKFLCEYIRSEDPVDAITRSIKTTMLNAEEEHIQSRDYLRYGNTNKICLDVTRGKISPWMLYQSDSGVACLSSMRSDQQGMIIDYINPELWKIKFNREPENVKQVKELLNAGGY